MKGGKQLDRKHASREGRTGALGDEGKGAHREGEVIVNTQKRLKFKKTKCIRQVGKKVE